MHVVFNILLLRPDTGWRAISERIDAFGRLIASSSTGFTVMGFVGTAPDEAVIRAPFDDRDELDRVSAEISGPGFAGNIRPSLGGTAIRSVGEVIAGRLHRSSPGRQPAEQGGERR